jgi:zinc/manganese transport system substrate-binding protein
LLRTAASTAAVLALAACATSGSLAGPGGTGVLRVVAAENFWGSIAAQLGGRQADVVDIIDNPNADPHEYEATASDGRAIAAADLVLVNGIGYDTWATNLVDANPSPHRVVLSVGDLLGVAPGGNPHRWYNPDDVRLVVSRIVAAYKKLEPTQAAYFAQQEAAFESTALVPYQAAVAQIKARYSGTPIGASESIMAMLAPALGLDLVTPPEFLRAVSAGSDPTAMDKATVDAQIKDHRIKVYVYNSQNATPDIQVQIAEAHAAGIPVTTITETMVPATTTWEQWQTAQLLALRDALARATGR